MIAFDLLSLPIRKFIRDKGWETLRPIQTAAINKIISSNDSFILASRTASGKTEAAFLPILTKVDFSQAGVGVLYISPLIALINDQFTRIEELCKNIDIKVTKWHGEAKQSEKNDLIKNPQGIVLITPESLEAMFVNKPYNIKHLFSNLKYVVIDEIHAFIGSDRGIQLKSILSRLKYTTNANFSVIGLSATIGNYDEAKKMTIDESNAKVLLDKTVKDINVYFRYFQASSPDLPFALIKDLYLQIVNSKALIFPNSRGRVEEVAVKLKKIAEKIQGHTNYFSHHSSVDKEVREYVEFFAKNNKRENFAISCTSTLELGIDIGSVDEVIQIDATFSIASLIQRIGRSGRREGASSNLVLYSTDKWSLLQSLACWLLYKDEFIESPHIKLKPYDVLLHQILSIVKASSGIRLSLLIDIIKNNKAFINIEQAEIVDILKHLIEIHFLEKIHNELILGVEGEKIVNTKDFYSVFIIEENFKVVSNGLSIGQIPLSPQIIEGANILLSAKIWTIQYIDFKSKKIEVFPAKDGKKPQFFGGEGIVDSRIRIKMYQLLYDYSQEYTFLDNISSAMLEIMQNEFKIFEIIDTNTQRPILIKEKEIQFFSFMGTKINRTINLFFLMLEYDFIWNEYQSYFEIKEDCLETFLSKYKSILNFIPSQIDDYILKLLNDKRLSLEFSKWGEYLPSLYQVKLLKNDYFAIEETMKFISTIEFISN